MTCVYCASYITLGIYTMTPFMKYSLVALMLTGLTACDNAADSTKTAAAKPAESKTAPAADANANTAPAVKAQEATAAEAKAAPSAPQAPVQAEAHIGRAHV